ncbi:MAG: hypothetical protein WC291_00915 [Thermodesulfovibrionales bacterium]|jgi:hypothetical protein
MRPVEAMGGDAGPSAAQGKGSTMESIADTITILLIIAAWALGFWSTIGGFNG